MGSDREKIWKEAGELVLKGTSTSIDSVPSHLSEIPDISNASVDLWVEKYKPKKVYRPAL